MMPAARASCSMATMMAAASLHGTMMMMTGLTDSIQAAMEMLRNVVRGWPMMPLKCYATLMPLKRYATPQETQLQKTKGTILATMQRSLPLGHTQAELVAAMHRQKRVQWRLGNGDQEGGLLGSAV